MLTNKIAIVTGGGRGIGKAIALELAGAGAKVAVVDYGSPEIAAETVAEINALGSECKAYQCDVSSFEATKATVSAIIADFGGIDILVNNAGITRDCLLIAMSEENFDAVINTNLKGAFNMIKHLYSNFIRKKSGRIINITSVIGINGNAGQGNYASAKAGLIGLTKTVAKELAGKNVTCNAIAPGFIQTDMTAVLSEKVVEKTLEGIPLKKMGQPKDIAKMVVFLAGEGGNYITGEVIKVDGGLSM